jgi:hypothetical protein
MDGAVANIRQHFGNGPQTIVLEEFSRAIVARPLALVKNDLTPAFTQLPGPGHLERDTVAGRCF